MKLPLLNGWMRLYVIAVALWVGAMAYWLYMALPERYGQESLSFRASSMVADVIEHIRKTPDALARYKSADAFCEDAYTKAQGAGRSINKNQCLEHILNAQGKGATELAISEIEITSATRQEKLRELGQAQDEQFRSALENLLPGFATRLIGGPVLLFVCGYLVGWVRRGFQFNQQR